MLLTPCDQIPRKILKFVNTQWKKILTPEKNEITELTWKRRGKVLEMAPPNNGRSADISSGISFFKLPLEKSRGKFELKTKMKWKMRTEKRKLPFYRRLKEKWEIYWCRGRRVWCSSVSSSSSSSSRFFDFLYICYNCLVERRAVEEPKSRAVSLRMTRLAAYRLSEVEVEVESWSTGRVLAMVSS